MFETEMTSTAMELHSYSK